MRKSETTIAPQKQRPKKRWGQHFLIDPNIARKIVDCASIQEGESIVEIGPGRGFLTKALLKNGAKVTAIEIDADLVKMLQAESDLADDIKPPTNLTLIQGDALRYPYQDIPAPYKVVANLPYNISTPLLFRLLEEKTRISRMVLMLQREVAERMVASTGDKSYGALSILLAFYTDVKIAFFVSLNCFKPKPKVASAVVCLTPLKTSRIHVQDEPLFLKTVKGAFLYRRKRIANALLCAGFSEKRVKTALQIMACDPARRGETFTLIEFGKLADTLSDLGKTEHSPSEKSPEISRRSH